SDVLGFQKRHDIPLGEARWLTVVSPEDPDGTELLLEPDGHPAVGPYKSALVSDGIPAASCQVDDVQAEHDRLGQRGVTSTQRRAAMGNGTTAVLDDACGNLLQIAQINSALQPAAQELQHGPAHGSALVVPDVVDLEAPGL